MVADDAKIVKLWTEKYPNLHTRYCYRLDSERLLEHAKKGLSRITLVDLQSFAESLIAAGLAPVSRVRVLAAAKSLLGFAFRMRHIKTNPAAELALPRYEIRLSERILGEEDVQRMLAVDAEPGDRVLLQLLYGGGLRVSEAVGLRWRNLRPHGTAGQITVYGKGGRTRSIALPAPLWSELIRLCGSAGAEEPVFPSRSGKALDRGRVRVIVRQAAERAGVAAAVSPHWLRHAHASHALDHGAPIHLVQATLGHSSVATTSIYLHARPCASSARFLASIAAAATTPQEPEATRTATVAQQVRRVAPPEARAGWGRRPPAQERRLKGADVAAGTRTANRPLDSSGIPKAALRNNIST